MRCSSARAGKRLTGKSLRPHKCGETSIYGATRLPDWIVGDSLRAHDVGVLPYHDDAALTAHRASIVALKRRAHNVFALRHALDRKAIIDRRPIAFQRNH